MPDYRFQPAAVEPSGAKDHEWITGTAEVISRKSISVIVPTWRRPQDLERCLVSLLGQTVLPDEIIVAAKEGDIETLRLVERLQSEDAEARFLLSRSGAGANVVGQQNEALALSSGDIVALTDDDSVPRLDWIESIVPYYDDPSVGGVGGRDWQPVERWGEARVGRLQWFGRVIGNHHLGVGVARDVEVLKGVNCSFRGRELRELGFSRAMRGRGTVIHWELAICFAFLRKGFRLIYDPAIAVDHNIVPRLDGDTNQRGVFEPTSFVHIVHNETYSLLEHLSPVRRLAFFIWCTSIGTRGVPGLAQVPRLVLLERQPASLVLRRAWAGIQGRLEGFATWRSSRKAVPPT